MSKKTIIITGANGEIGHSLINLLIEKNIFNIVAIDLKPPTFNFKIDQFIQGSVLDVNLLNQIGQTYTIDSIYHLAAILSTSAEKNPSLANDVNINGTINMLKLCNKAAKKQNSIIPFFFPSSIAVYNVIIDNKIKIKEKETKILPITNYGKAKLECENIGINMHNQSQVYGIDFRSIRFPGIISGTSMPFGGTSDYAPEMIHYAAQQQIYNCYVNGNRQLPFITMPDAINAILQLMRHKKTNLTQNVYNITSFNPTVEAFYTKTKEYFLDFELVYKIDNNRQKIIDSWPNDIDDSCAKNDWKWSPQYNFNSAYDEYLIPAIQKKYNSVV